MILSHGASWVLDSWKSENVLKSLLGLFPILLLDLNLRLHEHEDGVVPDGEVLSERLLKEVVGCAHVASVGVDDSGEDVGLYHTGVLTQAIVNLTKRSGGVIEQPASLRQKNLGLSES